MIEQFVSNIFKAAFVAVCAHYVVKTLYGAAAVVTILEQLAK